MTIKRTWLWAGAAVLAVVIVALVSAGVSLAQALIAVLLLTCVLMHFLGGRRHGAGGGRGVSAGTHDDHAGVPSRMAAERRRGAMTAPVESMPGASAPEARPTTPAVREDTSVDGTRETRA